MHATGHWTRTAREADALDAVTIGKGMRAFVQHRRQEKTPLL